MAASKEDEQAAPRARLQRDRMVMGVERRVPITDEASLHELLDTLPWIDASWLVQVLTFLSAQVEQRINASAWIEGAHGLWELASRPQNLHAFKPETLALIDGFTRRDARLFVAALARFRSDIAAAERVAGCRILCDAAAVKADELAQTYRSV